MVLRQESDDVPALGLKHDHEGYIREMDLAEVKGNLALAVADYNRAYVVDDMLGATSDTVNDNATLIVEAANPDVGFGWPVLVFVDPAVGGRQLIVGASGAYKAGPEPFYVFDQYGTVTEEEAVGRVEGGAA